ncbi:MAG: protein kinase domain-containing protein [Jatrophihabitans sp.]
MATTRTGAVWKARDVTLDRFVALKQVDGHERESLYREAAALAGIVEPHVVGVYGIAEEVDHTYLVEEWVDGSTLAALLRTHGRLTTAQALGVARGLLLGLAAVHRLGLVHGDVSLSNILVTADGTARLVDFGSVTTVGGLALAATGAFAAPEVRAGARVTSTADVYAAAAVLTTLLHGRTDPVPTTRGVDAVVRPVLERALHPEPFARQPDAAVLLRELEQAAHRRYGAQWWTQAGLGALALGGVAALVPLAEALHGGALAGTGSVGGSGAGAATATTTAAGSPGVAHPIGWSLWHGRRLAWVLAGGGATAAAVAVALVATSGTDAPKAAPLPAPVTATSSGSLSASTTSPPLVGNGPPTPAPAPLRHGTALISWRLRSSCAGCPVDARSGRVGLDVTRASSGRDSSGRFDVLVESADHRSSLALAGRFPTGEVVDVPLGATSSSVDAVGTPLVSAVLALRPAAGVLSAVSVGITPNPATAACRLTIDSSSDRRLAGGYTCDTVTSSDGRYTYELRASFVLTR